MFLFHFYTLSKTLIACRAMHLIFLKVKTLLTNAFNPRGVRREGRGFWVGACLWD